MGNFTLTERQLLTISHLKTHQNISTPEEIIAYCKKKLELPVYNKNIPNRPRRGHGKQYYQDIINFYTQ